MNTEDKNNIKRAKADWPRLKPGHYVLGCDVTNPKPDRRMTRSFVHQPVWEKGTLFYVREELIPNPMRDDDSKILQNRLELTEGRYSTRWLPWEEIYETLMPHLVPCPDESYEQLLHRLDYSPTSLLRRLFKAGLVSVAELEGVAQLDEE